MSGLRSTGRTKSSVLGSCLPAWRLPPWSLLQTSSAEAKRLVASRRFGEKQGIDATQAKPHGCCKDTVINWSKASNFRSRGRQVWGDRPGDCLMVGDGDLRCPSCSAFLEELQYITQMRCPGSILLGLLPFKSCLQELQEMRCSSIFPHSISLPAHTVLHHLRYACLIQDTRDGPRIHHTTREGPRSCPRRRGLSGEPASLMPTDPSQKSPGDPPLSRSGLP